MKLRLFLGAIVVACVISACAISSSNAKQNSLTREEANAISDQLVLAIERRYPLLQHRQVNRYVDSLGQSIVSRNAKMPPLPYEFRVLKTNEVETFSTPAGIVYVSLGMLRLCEIEAQFAAVLSHELAHQRLGHSLLVWQDRLQALRSKSSAVLPDKRLWSDRLLGPNGLMYYGEAKEREADQLTFAILYNAGYDTRAFLSFFQLLKNKEASSPRDVAGLLSLHPPTINRLAWAKTDAFKLPPVSNAKLNSNSFISIQRLLKKAETNTKTKQPRRPIESSKHADPGATEI